MLILINVDNWFLNIIIFIFWCDRSGQYVWEDHRPRSGIWKGSNGGEVISISGCDDDQTSADTSVSPRKLGLNLNSSDLHYRLYEHR